MPHSLVWLPHVLREAGLKVAPVDGWEERGRGDVREIFGVICHYTQGPRRGNMPSLGTLLTGAAICRAHSPSSASGATARTT